MPEYRSDYIVSIKPQGGVKPRTFLQLLAYIIEKLDSLEPPPWPPGTLDSLAADAVKTLGINRSYRLEKSILQNDLRRLGVISLGDPCKDRKGARSSKAEPGIVGRAALEVLNTCRELSGGNEGDCSLVAAAFAVLYAGVAAEDESVFLTKKGPCRELSRRLLAVLHGETEGNDAEQKRLFELTREAAAILREAVSRRRLPYFYAAILGLGQGTDEGESSD